MGVCVFGVFKMFFEEFFADSDALVKDKKSAHKNGMIKNNHSYFRHISKTTNDINHRTS